MSLPLRSKHSPCPCSHTALIYVLFLTLWRQEYPLCTGYIRNKWHILIINYLFMETIKINLFCAFCNTLCETVHDTAQHCFTYPSNKIKKVKPQSMPWRHTGGRRGKAPAILYLGTRWRWVIYFMPWPLYQLETAPVLIALEAAWAPGLVWVHSRWEKSLAPAKFKPCIVWPTVQSLYWLLLFH